jgi:hypothetical protein
MENPLEKPVPEDSIKRAEKFACDFVWGIANNLWGEIVVILPDPDGTREYFFNRDGDEKYSNFRKYIANVWNGNPPSRISLQQSGLFYTVDRMGNSSTLAPTEKAYKLLQTFSNTNVFISYGHKQSSALALLLESKLHQSNSGIGVFIDKSIPVSHAWHAHLEATVRDSEYFICLLGQVTEMDEQGEHKVLASLDSTYVQNEIRWAIDAGLKITFVCHNGYMLPQKQNGMDNSVWSLIVALRSKQGTIINIESAEEYHIKISKLISELITNNQQPITKD